LPDQAGVDRFITPGNYKSDLVTNNEIGWKTEWFDHRFLFNGALYQENWDNVQTYVFCPQCGLGNIPYISNGPFYKVKGVEISLAARPTSGLTVQGSAAWNSSNLTNSPKLIANNPASAEYGQPITQQYVNGVVLPIPNVYGEPNSPLANSPPFQANLLVRYEHPVGEYVPYIQGAFQHQAHSLSAVGYELQFQQPAWTTYDAAIGVSKDSWTVSVVGVNVTNVNKALYITSVQAIQTNTPIRPRTISLTFSYSFKGH
jgi:outer membrane receptor protein involved in Fe transport